MAIENIRFEAIKNIVGEATKGKPRGEGDQNFASIFKNAIDSMNQMDEEAQRKVQDTMTGKKISSPHELMISLEKADLAFELMNKVRVQLVRTYEEIMRTQV